MYVYKTSNVSNLHIHNCTYLHTHTLLCTYTREGGAHKFPSEDSERGQRKGLHIHAYTHSFVYAHRRDPQKQTSNDSKKNPQYTHTHRHTYIRTRVCILHTYTHTHLHMHTHTFIRTDLHVHTDTYSSKDSEKGQWYGVATISRLLKITGLFCKI